METSIHKVLKIEVGLIDTLRCSNIEDKFYTRDLIVTSLAGFGDNKKEINERIVLFAENKKALKLVKEVKDDE